MRIGFIGFQEKLSAVVVTELRSSHHDFDVLYVESMEQAKDWTISTRPDLAFVLIDFESNEATNLRAIETLENLSRYPQLPPVIVIAANGAERSAVRLMRAGVADYLPAAGLSRRDLREAVDFVYQPDKEGERTLDLGTEADNDVTTFLNGTNGGNLLHGAPEIPGYKIIRPIGSGGTAEVYLAHFEELGEDAVLKIIDLSNANSFSDDLRKRFEFECDVISNINNKRVVDIFDYGIMAESAYLCIEYFPCGDFKFRLQNPVEPVDALKYALQVAEALEIVHDKNILHRDLKPANVMVREDNTLALIDFGLAKADTDLTNTFRALGQVHGTPLYMSPEQIEGAALDVRSDIFAAGIILFEALAGFNPFRAETLAAVLDKRLEAPSPQLPEHLAQYQYLIDQTVNIDPNQRLQTAREFVDLINAELSRG